MKRHLSNLPTEVTSFVGRRQELREVKRLLSTTRQLTLTGSGGVGKTKLALRAAAEMSRGFPDGAWLVLLASINDPLLVTQAVFNALGVHDLSAGLSLSSLTDYLAGKRLLLVLDNCEHLLDACAVLASTLIGSCPDLHVLATSPSSRLLRSPPAEAHGGSDPIRPGPRGIGGSHRFPKPAQQRSCGHTACRMSRTMSVPGWAQQMSTSPSAGGSSGSGE
jgi:NB-ARC domain